MTDEIVHEIVIDESNSYQSEDIAWRAYCTDACGWQGEWQHSDTFTDREDSHPVDLAYAEAYQEGQTHLMAVIANGGDARV